jgi:hypothetical protein
MRTLAVRRPGLRRGADAGAAQPEPGVASEDRPWLAIAQSQLDPSRVTTPNASQHYAATTATRASPRGASVRTGPTP